MERIKKIIILLMVVASSINSFGETITTLLNEYEEARIEKTKDDTIGYVYIFSRKDIEQLQLNTVGDALKLVLGGYYLPNIYGVKNFMYASSITRVAEDIRLFIDDHEVSSVHTLSPFFIYDDYPLTNIDYIEIYVMGINSRLSAENGHLIVKLYTKDPSKENVTVVKALADSKKGYGLSFSSAYQISPYSSYFVMVNRSEKNFTKPVLYRTENNRNYDRTDAYLKFVYFDTVIQFLATRIKRGIFGGLSADLSPDYGRLDGTNLSVSITQKLLQDKSLELFMSYDWQDRKREESNQFPLLIYKPYEDPIFGYPVYYDDRRKFSKFVISGRKQFETDNNTLFVGGDLRNYTQSADVKTVYLTGYTREYTPYHVGYYHVYSVYFDEIYRLDKKWKFNISAKLERYSWDKNRDRTLLNGKAGFLYTQGRMLIKLFLTRMYIAPPIALIEVAATDALKPYITDVLIAGSEFRLRKKDRLKFYLFKGEIKDAYKYSSTFNGIINDDKIYRFAMVFTEYEARINNSHKLNLTGWVVSNENYRAYTPTVGGNLILHGQFRNAGYFLALLYRKNQTVKDVYIPDTYDLSAGLSYSFRDGLTLKVKGENLLNREQKVPYFSPVAGDGSYSSADRRLTISLEKVF
ncbi:hypothetical protein [Persephonella sp.]